MIAGWSVYDIFIARDNTSQRQSVQMTRFGSIVVWLFHPVQFENRKLRVIIPNFKFPMDFKRI